MHSSLSEGQLLSLEGALGNKGHHVPLHSRFVCLLTPHILILKPPLRGPKLQMAELTCVHFHNGCTV